MNEPKASPVSLLARACAAHPAAPAAPAPWGSPRPPAPAPQPRPPSPGHGSVLLLQQEPAPVGGCWAPLPPAPSPAHGWVAVVGAAQRSSPQPHACRPPSRRAPVRCGGGGAGAGPWAAAWVEDGVFPALAGSCRHRSPAPGAARTRAAGAAQLWGAQGQGGLVVGDGGSGVHQLPPNHGVSPPQHRAALQYAPTHWCLGRKRGALGRRRWAAQGTAGMARAGWQPGTRAAG